MRYRSTRNENEYVPSARAMINGIAPDGGLYIPESIPALTAEDIAVIGECNYGKTALTVLKKYLTDFSETELAEMVGAAYASFDVPEVAPLRKLSGEDYALELWHGPTSAFKDCALQILPYFITASAKKTGLDKTVHILVATSGDTGKAALEGFRDVEGTKITVFYPADGVSAMQKLQMMTQEGGNVRVCGISGNFDDAQTGVKRIFADRGIAEELAARGEILSSANSINWGRLVPQIAYYVHSWAALKAQGAPLGDGFNVVVPTGNFGNILAAYYAKMMGVPINKLVCASNKNRVLTDFFGTGVYDRNREFFTTESPSMDILISSNLERLLCYLADGSAEAVKSFMASLSAGGEYAVTGEMKRRASGLFFASCADDAETEATIGETFAKTGYLSDTHTAVGIKVCGDYRKATGDARPCVIASTASPYKFPAAVLRAIGGDASDDDPFALIERLEAKSGVPAPKRIAELKYKLPRFTDVCEPSRMAEAVLGAR
ncbi:MAG: threonine synthase [Clostridia bacterium]|nr:threonine synthase [Clostridia bacterium]